MLGRRVGVAIAAPVAALLLAACAGPKYTVDDGRKVDAALLERIRVYGAGERALRPAIARSAALHDPDCDKQWELPISVVSSDAWSEDDRVAWVRALGVDERLTVVSASADAPLVPGDRLATIDGYGRDIDAERMTMRLVRERDSGRPFNVKTATGKVVKLVPFEVCRGYTRLAPPNTPRLQDYHWLLSLHPLEVARVGLTDDEALWTVLWTQGLSEEGGVRMKAYHYGTKLIGTLYNLATIASGLKGAALAAEAATTTLQAATAQVAADVLRQQLLGQVGSYALDKVREGIAEDAHERARRQMLGGMALAAVNRSALSGVARIGATVFDRADLWAFERAAKLQGDPLAGFSLHQKLIEQGFTSNAFVFDVERLSALTKAAEAAGRGEDVVAVLKGLRPEALEVASADMPLASSSAAFSYDAVADTGATAFSRGLVDAMLEIPVESRGGK